MGLKLDPKHLARYKDLVRLLVKYGRSDVLEESGLEEIAADLGGDREAPPEARDLAADLERLGPTYIKLGQLLSTRPDLFPEPVLDELSRLQDSVEPFPYEEAVQILAEELGVRISKAFRTFDRDPLAAASLAQVHAAVLRNGRHVAVKIQRPGIRRTILDDLDVLDDIAEVVDRRTEVGRRFVFREMLRELRKALLRELDFRQEAQNLEVLGRNLSEFDRIVVPRPVDDYTTDRVLTMDHVYGRKITALSPLARMEMDGHDLAEQLFQAYLKQILVDGFFHADPHPGNVFLTEDGRLALLDLGMVARVAPSLQEKLLKLLLAVSEGRGEEAADVALDMAQPRGGTDEEGFAREVVELVGRYQGARVRDINVGQVVMQLNRLAGRSRLRLPAELTMLGKALLNLDEVGRTLDPDFDPNAAIRDHAGGVMQRRLLKTATPANLFSSVLEMNDFVQRLPGRLNRVLDTVAANELEVRVDAFDEVHLMEGLQKIANRITVGLVLAALIVGAAMLMRVDTDFELLGYPGLAIILFFLAAGGGVALVVDILLHDEKSGHSE